MRSVQHDEQAALEKLIDACGLQNVLYAMENICEEKRDHIETSYGDVDTAQPWHNAGVRLRKCAEGKTISALSEG